MFLSGDTGRIPACTDVALYSKDPEMSASSRILVPLSRAKISQMVKKTKICQLGSFGGVHILTKYSIIKTNSIVLALQNEQMTRSHWTFEND